MQWGPGKKHVGSHGARAYSGWSTRTRGPHGRNRVGELGCSTAQLDGNGLSTTVGIPRAPAMWAVPESIPMNNWAPARRRTSWQRLVRPASDAAKWEREPTA